MAAYYLLEAVGIEEVEQLFVAVRIDCSGAPDCAATLTLLHLAAMRSILTTDDSAASGV